MGELVNLRSVKKRRARAQEAEEAAANRQLHGRSKAQRLSEAASQRLAERTLDQAKLDPPSD